jgi:hypothetical protein
VAGDAAGGVGGGEGRVRWYKATLKQLGARIRTCTYLRSQGTRTTFRMSTTDTLATILPALRRHTGKKYCAPCLAKATGIADANEVRRVMDRASELPEVVVGQDECDTCHTVRRTLSTA